MNPGDKTHVVETPMGTIIYATNMVPECVWKEPGESDEDHKRLVELKRQQYERKLNRREAGEDVDGGNGCDATAAL